MLHVIIYNNKWRQITAIKILMYKPFFHFPLKHFLQFAIEYYKYKNLHNGDNKFFHRLYRIANRKYTNILKCTLEQEKS